MASICAGIEGLEHRRLLSAAEPVWDFGYQGLVQDNRQSADGVVAALPDGKVLLARFLGIPWRVQTPGFTWLTRYLANGLPDPDFGGVAHGQPTGTPDGTVQVGPDVFLKDIAGMKVDSNGKILIAGTYQTGTDEKSGDIVVVRLRSDGLPDTSFGGPAGGYANAFAGLAQLDLQNNSDDVATDLALAADGRIAVVGKSTNDSGASAIAIVLNPDGSRNASFDDDGLLIWHTGSASDFVGIRYDVAAADFDSNGNLIIGGTQRKNTNDGQYVVDLDSWILSSFTPNGELVWNASLRPNNFRGFLRDVAVSHDGAVYAVGSIYRDAGCARVMLADGTLDPNFGEYGGFLRTTPVLEPGVFPNGGGALAVSALSDGRFYFLADTSHGQDNYQFSYDISRYMPDGTIDPIYGGPWNVEHGQVILWSDFALNGQNPLVVNDKLVSFQDQMIHVSRIHQYQGAESARLTHTGNLQIGGTVGADTILVTLRTRDNRIIVRVNGDKLIRSYPRSGIKRIELYSFGGDDSVTVGDGLPRGILIDGGIGADTLGGGDLNDTISGGTDNDVITGGAGSDILQGNSGNDYLFGGAGNDTLFGSAGRDTLRGEDGDDQFFGGSAGDLIYGGIGVDSSSIDPLDRYRDIELLI